MSIPPKWQRIRRSKIEIGLVRRDVGEIRGKDDHLKWMQIGTYLRVWDFGMANSIKQIKRFWGDADVA